MGIATDSKGDIWITDTGNNRVQRWAASAVEPRGKALLAVKDDPKVEVNISNGLVSSVEGEEAGQHT